MTEIELQINKQTVYREVEKTAAYTGAMMGEENAYEHISLTDENREAMERFWDEAKSTACSRLKRVLLSEEEDREGTFRMRLGLSNAFAPSFVKGMERGVFSFFVRWIAGKWFGFVNKPESAGYLADAVAMLDDVARMAVFKKGPLRSSFGG